MAMYNNVLIVFCVIFLSINSFLNCTEIQQIENDYYKYEIISDVRKVNLYNRARRQTEEISLTAVPDVGAKQSDIVTITDNNNVTVVNAMKVSTDNTVENIPSSIIDKEILIPKNVSDDEYSKVEAAFIDSVDVLENETNTLIGQHNITNIKEDNFQYYTSVSSIDKSFTDALLVNFTKLEENKILSRSHRRAITVQLSFDFPFYGHPVRNVTIATGGFLYTGEYVHSWLAATQYIAPLMANFDTSLSDTTFVKYGDNGTAFTVLWENVFLQDLPNIGPFSFSVTLHDSGDIVFVYYEVPIRITSIVNEKRPVKVGLSDAYIMDKVIFFARRKTIYEYHRVNLAYEVIRTNGIVYLTAQETCISFTDCENCVNSQVSTGRCTWCPAINRCSNGMDRKRQEWLAKNCDSIRITTSEVCSMNGTQVNNYNSQPKIEVHLANNDKYTHSSDVDNNNIGVNFVHKEPKAVAADINEIENDYYKYKIISDVRKVNLYNRARRQTEEISTTAVPDVGAKQSDIVTITDNNNVTVVNAMKVSTDNTMENIPSSIIDKEPKLLGVNGTGQRWNVTKTALLSSDPTANQMVTTTSTTTVAPTTTIIPIVKTNAITPVKPTQMLIPKNVSDDEYSKVEAAFIDSVDVLENETNTLIGQHNITNIKEDNFQYYTSVSAVNKPFTDALLVNFTKLEENKILSRSHRRAITVQLSFNFPFYGHPVRNVTVATGGFLYTGEYVHSWLAATQYIAPLMANFDSSISNNSFVKCGDNGTAFTVLWENVYLQDKPSIGPFSFSVTLHDSGDIVFAYYEVPIQINSIMDEKHPVKSGLSDAYIIDKLIFFARRKTIYEYHRVNFGGEVVRTNGIVYLTAQETCIGFTDCENCVNSQVPTGRCTWCTAINRCSTGMDRKRQDWLAKNCDSIQITTAEVCPMNGTHGNNYNSQQEIEVDLSNNSNKYPDNKYMHGSDENNADANNVGVNTLTKDSIDSINVVKADAAKSDSGSGGNYSLFLGLFIPIVLIVMFAMWLFYAYRNPHTKSGQFVIQYRPSQWSWRRGEARYTAATIHM